MALQIRRGTLAELQTITPLEGELIYTTDTDDVYIGDGVTIGGILVTASLGNLEITSTTVNGVPTTTISDSDSTGTLIVSDGSGANSIRMSTTGTFFSSTATVTAIKFPDGSVQTTADTANPNQSLNTSSSVTFVSVTTTNITINNTTSYSLQWNGGAFKLQDNETGNASYIESTRPEIVISANGGSGGTIRLGNGDQLKLSDTIWFLDNLYLKVGASSITAMSANTSSVTMTLPLEATTATITYTNIAAVGQLKSQETTLATTGTAIFSFAHDDYKGCRAQICVWGNPDPMSLDVYYQTVDMNVLSDGTNTYNSTYGELCSTSTALATFTSAINGSTTEIRITPAAGVATLDCKVVGQLIKGLVIGGL